MEAAAAAEPAYMPAALVSCVFFLAIYKFVSPSLSAKLCPGYTDLTPCKQIDWNTRTVSSVHAILVSSVCIYLFLTDDELADDPCWANSHLVRYNCAIVLGYMTSDFIVMMANYKELCETFYVVHHCASICAYYFVMSYGACTGFANYRLLAEVSTPLVNVRWFLDVLRYPKTSKPFVANGLTMALSFFLVRIVVIPPFWAKVLAVRGTESFVRLGNIKYVLYSVPFVLDVINVYWFSKIVKGARRVLSATAKQISSGEKSTEDIKLE